jgi:microcystin-dependent protein
MSLYWPRSNSFEFNDEGDVAPGAKVYFFDAGTSTPKTTYSDAALTTPRTHPVTADGNGRWPAVFLDFGSFREVATTSGGTELWSADNIPNTAPTDPGEGVDADSIAQTGDYLFVGKNGTRTGYVRCNGRTIGSASSSGSERANADCEDLFTYLWNNYAQGQCAVVGGRGASAAADWAANKRISVPDHRGATLIGFDDMGNTDSGQTDNAPVETGSGIVAGSILGLNTHVLTEAQLPEHDHSVNITSGNESVTHTHSDGTFAAAGGGAHTPAGTVTPSGSISGSFTYDNTQSNAIAGGGLDTTNVQVAADGPKTVTVTDSRTFGFSGTPVADHTHDITGTSGNASVTHTHLVSGNTGNIGSGTAHNNMQRSVPVTVLMKL